MSASPHKISGPAAESRADFDDLYRRQWLGRMTTDGHPYQHDEGQRTDLRYPHNRRSGTPGIHRTVSAKANTCSDRVVDPW